MRFANEMVRVLVLSLLTLACTRPSSPESVEKLTAALDFPAGNVQGTITWNNQPLDSPSSLLLNGGSWTAYVVGSGTYYAPDVAPGDYAVEVRSYLDCTGATLATGTVTVEATQTSTLDLDISATAGIVRGVITANGAGLPDTRVAIRNTALPYYCSSFYPSAAGAFSQLLPVGAYEATVRSDSGTLGTFNFNIVAGQTSDVDVEVARGTVQGQITWDNASVGSQSGLIVNGGPWSTYVGWMGSYEAQSVLPGDYAVSVTSYLGCGDTVASGNVSVTDGTTTTRDFDVTATMGVLKGAITINGAAVFGTRINLVKPEAGYSCGTFYANADGTFQQLLPAGTYDARVFSDTGAIGSFSFTLPAGETLDRGTLEFSTGSIEGTVQWGTDPHDPERPRLVGPQNGLYVSSGGWTAYVDGTGHYRASNVPPGTYPLTIRSYQSCNQGDLAFGSATVTAGGTAQVNFDVNSTVGEVKGSITVNGTALPGARLVVRSPSQGYGCGSIYTDFTGRFTQLLAAGAYEADVYSSSSKLGSFTFMVMAGQTTDVDIGSTQPGTNVELELSGGIDEVGGVSLAFDEVTTGGTTIVVESGAGPPPPLGTRVVGLDGQPRYWDFQTTAVFAAGIEVCIHYDDTQALGPESALMLLHDDGTGWKDITTSRDPAANVICGVTTSLSPFAVVEPLVVVETDTDGDGVLDTNDLCPATASGGVVDPAGCSLDQLVPCDGDWKNHGAYVSTFSKAADRFVSLGLISAATREQLVSAAARSRCGKSGY